MAEKNFLETPPPLPRDPFCRKKTFFFSTHCLNKVHFTRISCATGTMPIYLSIYLPLALQIRWRSLGFSACSRRSDNGMRCWVKEQEKNKKPERGRGAGTLPSLPSPPPRCLLHLALSPQSERLEQAKVLCIALSEKHLVFLIGIIRNSLGSLGGLRDWDSI